MEDNSKVSFWDVVKGVCVIALMIGVSVKIYNIPIVLNVDFPTLLSLILALFSVGLSAMFYFKATDTSNKFYDNTYKFTRDIAQLLVKMESGFGERLRNLDEGYTSMRGYIQNGWGGRDADDGKETKEQLKQEKEEIKKVVEERNSIVESLIERSQLEAEEKERISISLKEKETEIAALQAQVTKLNRRRTLERVRNQSDAKSLDFNDPLVRVSSYMRSKLIKIMGGAERLSIRPIRLIIKSFGANEDQMHENFLKDLRELELYEDGQLTVEGARLIKEAAKEISNATLE